MNLIYPLHIFILCIIIVATFLLSSLFIFISNLKKAEIPESVLLIMNLFLDIVILFRLKSCLLKALKLGECELAFAEVLDYSSITINGRKVVDILVLIFKDSLEIKVYLLRWLLSHLQLFLSLANIATQWLKVRAKATTACGQIIILLTL